MKKLLLTFLILASHVSYGQLSIPSDLSVGGRVNILGYYNGDFRVSGSVAATNGFASMASNTLALASISFPATTVNWTNTTAISGGKNIFVFIDNAGVTGTALKINGTQISSTLLTTGDTIIPLQPGEYFSETYTVGTPTAVWKPQ